MTINTLKPRRSVLPLALAVFGCVASAIGLVYATHESRSLFVELEQLTAERDELDIEWGQLQIEQSTWATHARIERVALDELALKRPSPSEIYLIERQ